MSRMHVQLLQVGQMWDIYGGWEEGLPAHQ